MKKPLADKLLEDLDSYFETNVSVPRIKHGNKQELESLINEEALLQSYVHWILYELILFLCVHSLCDCSSQLRDLKIVLDTIFTFRASSDGHISTQRKQSMHIDVSIFPSFLSYTSVTCNGQTLLQMPHLVHLPSSLLR